MKLSASTIYLTFFAFVLGIWVLWESPANADFATERDPSVEGAAGAVPPGEASGPVREPPKPPTTGPSASQGVPGTPGPAPAPMSPTVGPNRNPLPVGRGSGPKGPDDPRFAVPPGPPVDPNPPPEDGGLHGAKPTNDPRFNPAPTPPADPNPPPEDGGLQRAMPGEEPVDQGSPRMTRKPARPPVKIQEDIPKPKPR